MIKKPIILAALLWATVFATSGMAQFSLLHSFGPDNSNFNQPLGTVDVDGSVIYGTTAFTNGRVISMNTDGTNLQQIHVFQGFVSHPTTTGVADVIPTGPLTQIGSALYGTTVYGSSVNTNDGKVYTVNTDGSGFQELHNFGPADGSPITGLTLGGSVLYGTTGYTTNGTIYKLNPDGSGFQTLHSFSGNDGITKISGLTLSGSVLYGTASAGGQNNDGTLFEINTDGTGFQVLHAFAGGASDGANPSYGPLVLSGSTLIGTTSAGGAAGLGTIFGMNTDGSGFQVIHSFDGNAGANPVCGLILDGSLLYGMTSLKSPFNAGTIFELNTNGSGFQVLHTFVGGAGDGSYPMGGLTLSGSTLYGTTQLGGPSNGGTIFALTVPEPSSLLLAAFGFISLAAWRALTRSRRASH